MVKVKIKKENIYQTALEYLRTAAKAEKNGFSTEKTKKAVKWIDEIQQRVLDPNKHHLDRFYKASKEISDLVRFCNTYLDRARVYLRNLDLDVERPCKILYDYITTDEVYYVNTEFLYEDDSREEREYFSYKSKTYKEFEEELNQKYETRGIRVLFIDGPYLRKSTTYKWRMGLHTFNEDISMKGGE
jgi:hypothetical protein